MIISFGWTSAAFRALQKDTTRRKWKAKHAAKFEAGKMVDAWSAGPHRKGKPIGRIQIESVVLEKLCDIPSEDCYREGFHFLEALGYKIIYTVRFTVVDCDFEPQAYEPVPLAKECCICQVDRAHLCPPQCQANYCDLLKRDLGIVIVGAIPIITKMRYPCMVVRPDGLIGFDMGLWKCA